MDVAQRISLLSPSPTIELNSLAQQLKKRGEQVVNFAVGEPDFDTPDVIIQAAIAGLKKGQTKYGASGGSLELRTAICQKLLKENKLSFKPENIVVGTGAKEVLYHMFMAMLNEGDEVILPAPYWVSYSEQVKVAGGVPVVIPFAGLENPIDVEAIARAITPKTKAIVFNSPNNPAGYIMKQNMWQKLAQMLKKTDCYIISDEIYEYLSFDEAYHSIIESDPNLMERLVVVNGCSKGYAMTGFRVGYLAAPKPLADAVKTLISHSSTCIPGFIDHAAQTALAHGPELLAKEWAGLRKRRDIALELLNGIRDVRFIYPQGAFYIFIDIRAILDKQRDKYPSSMTFGKMLLEKHKVAMVPGEAFGCPGFLRLSYTVSETDLRKGIMELKAACNA
ncbi:MAG: pyridoxal phosphate-dependent aminotransferase [Oligoflexales bacterium]